MKIHTFSSGEEISIKTSVQKEKDGQEESGTGSKRNVGDKIVNAMNQ